MVPESIHGMTGDTIAHQHKSEHRIAAESALSDNTDVYPSAGYSVGHLSAHIHD